MVGNAARHTGLAGEAQGERGGCPAIHPSPPARLSRESKELLVLDGVVGSVEGCSVVVTWAIVPPAKSGKNLLKCRDNLRGAVLAHW